MPGTPKPVVDPRFGPLYTPIIQQAQAQKQAASALNSGASQGNLFDQWGNTIQLSGSNLNQTVTIGASHGVAGVLVSTGIAPGVAGLAVQSGPAITTITLTQGSASATIGTVTGASLSAGQVIGAADVSDPSSGTPTPALSPGTTILSVSGTAITLSRVAAESGTALYCAAARFVLQQDSGWIPLTLSSGFTPATSPTIPSARLRGDIVTLRGGIDGTPGWGAAQAIASVPANMVPANAPVLPAVMFNGSTYQGIGLEVGGAGTGLAGDLAPLLAVASGAIFFEGAEYSIS